MIVIDEAQLAEQHRRRELNHWASSCLAKVQYASEELAEKVAKKAMRTRKVAVYPYWCDYCKGYHLSKLEKRR